MDCLGHWGAVVGLAVPLPAIGLVDGWEVHVGHREACFLHEGDRGSGSSSEVVVEGGHPSSLQCPSRPNWERQC